MNENTNLITSIENVVSLINNSIILFRDFDKELNKLGFSSVDEKNLSTATTNAIFQSPDSGKTLFPQFISRTYIKNNTNCISKIIQINVQFYHGEYFALPPTLISSIILLKPNHPPKYGVHWIKEVAFELMNFEEDVKKHGEINKFKDNGGYTNIFWCNDLIKFNNPTDVKNECLKIQKEFESTSV